jgi:hypothetical protein
MGVSMAEIYKKTNTSSEFMLMPVTSNLDGKYYGEAMVNMVLAFLLSVYNEAETKEQLESVRDDEHDKGWVPVMNVYEYVDRDKDEDMESTEYSILKSHEKGYIEVTIWDNVRYFKPTEKCLNLELYKFRKNL